MESLHVDIGAEVHYPHFKGISRSYITDTPLHKTSDNIQLQNLQQKLNTFYQDKFPFTIKTNFIETYLTKCEVKNFSEGKRNNALTCTQALQ